MSARGGGPTASQRLLALGLCALALGGCSLMGLFDLPPAESCRGHADCAALLQPGADPCAGYACLEGACQTVAYRDLDGDGFSPPGCAAPPPVDGQGGADGDCDDRDPLSHPGAAERCDRVDNDCDGQTDEGSLSLVDPQSLQIAPSPAVIPGLVAASLSPAAGTAVAWIDQLLAASAGPAFATVRADTGAVEGPQRIDAAGSPAAGLNAVALALAPYPGAVRQAALLVSTSTGCAPIQNGASGELRLLSLPDPLSDLEADLLTPRCVDGAGHDAAVHPSVAVDPRAGGPVGAVAFLRQTRRERLGDRACGDTSAASARDVALFTFRFGRTVHVDAPGEIECGRMPVDGGVDGATVPRVSACREADVPMPAVYQARYDEGCVCRGEGFGMFAESTVTGVELEPLVAGRSVDDDAVALAAIESLGFVAAWTVEGGALELRRVIVAPGDEGNPRVDATALATVPAAGGGWSHPRLAVLDGSPTVVFLVASRGCDAAQELVLLRGVLAGTTLSLGAERVLAGAGSRPGPGSLARHEEGVLVVWSEQDRLLGARVAQDGALLDERLALSPDRVSVGAAEAVERTDGTAAVALAVLASEDPAWTAGVSYARVGCGP